MRSAARFGIDHLSLFVWTIFERQLPRQHTTRLIRASPEGEAVAPGTSLFSINGLPITNR
jgi:hypothetical protein